MRDLPLQLGGLLRRMLREVLGIQNGRPLWMFGNCFCTVLIDVFACKLAKVRGAPFFSRAFPFMYDTQDGVDPYLARTIFLANTID